MEVTFKATVSNINSEGCKDEIAQLVKALSETVNVYMFSNIVKVNKSRI